MKKNVIGLVALLIGVGAIAYFYFFPKKPIHYHAGFKVFIDGKEQDFRLAQFVSLIPCGSTNSKYDQLEKAHLHDFVGDVVHVHRNNALWKDLFKNISFHFPKNKPIEGYINGKKVSQIMEDKIEPYDSVIILVGTHEKVQSYLKQSVTKSRIQAVEKKSESCGDYDTK